MTNDNELRRRLAIALNDQISENERLSYIGEGTSLSELCNRNNSFRFNELECESVFRWLDESDENRLIWKWDKGFPSFEGLTKHVPILLSCKGRIPVGNRTRLGVIGTRKPQYIGLQKAFALGLECSANGCDVVSGFAEGTDQAAMRGSLYGKGACIGVLACGMNVCYPSMTEYLRKEIVERGGCIISRFTPDTVPYKSNIVSRNMVISAFSDALITVQAPEKSGTLVTCDFAVSMGKSLYVSDCGTGEGYVRAGTNRLFLEGAQVISGIRDISPDYTGKVVETCENNKGNIRFGDRFYMVTETSK